MVGVPTSIQYGGELTGDARGNFDNVVAGADGKTFMVVGGERVYVGSVPIYTSKTGIKPINVQVQAGQGVNEGEGVL